jgi:hypothetical protein
MAMTPTWWRPVGFEGITLHKFMTNPYLVQKLSFYHHSFLNLEFH